MRGQVTVANGGAHPQAAARQRFDRVERQPRDIDQQHRPLHAELHQVHQVGAAAEKRRLRLAGHQSHRLGRIGGPVVAKAPHGTLPRIATSRMAAMMFG
jgi:hypothetical protein